MLPVNITVIGCGYLGTTHAAAMAELGHDVLGVEIDPDKRALLAAGKVPFFEPGLEALVGRHVASGRLRFTGSYEEAGAFADFHLVCVGTPQLASSMGADISQVNAAVGSLSPHLTRPSYVVGKSTVPVGTAARLAEHLTSHAPVGNDAELVWNPEFLREGFAVNDTLHPDRLVYGFRPGEAGERAARVLDEVYAATLADGTPKVETDLATAQLVKVAANSFLATKISFINAMAELCEVTGGEVPPPGGATGAATRNGRPVLKRGGGGGGGARGREARRGVRRCPGRRYAEDGDRPGHGPAGQGGRELVPGHQDLVHQRDGRAL